MPPQQNAMPEAGPGPEPDSPSQCRDRAAKLIRDGRPLSAYDLARRGLARWGDDIDLRQILARALLNSRAMAAGRAVLQKLFDAGHRDEETLGLLASAEKKLALAEPDPELRRAGLARARQAYQHALDHNPSGYWSAINLATLANLLGDKPAARRAAQLARELCQRQSGQRARDYWLAATLAEAALVAGELQEAAGLYARAAALAPGQVSDLAATLANARLNLDAMGLSESQRRTIEDAFPHHKVAVFCGHMIDRPNRATPRFPPALESQIKRAIRQSLAAHRVGVGFASAACGADILFLEALAETGGQINVVLPYNRRDFLKHSVAFAGPGWQKRFEKILDQAGKVVTTSDEPLGRGGVSFDYSKRIIMGMAINRARELESPLLGLAVWDGRPGDGPGGTADNLANWRGAGLASEVIDPGQFPPAVKPGPARPAAPPAPATPHLPPGMSEAPTKGLVFADAVGFSKLGERQVPVFVERYLSIVAGLLAQTNPKAIGRETWGDGLYAVFDNAGAAGGFALDLRDQIVATDWAGLGLPAGMSLRIAVHAGPVYTYRNPVTGQPGFTGSHVSRAARIEPVTPPGVVYASGAFAAIAAAEGVTGFTCEYVGETPLAKNRGTFPTYALRKTGAQTGPAAPGPGRDDQPLVQGLAK